VPRIFTLFALLLALLWLPATMHCDLAAAGFVDWWGSHEVSHHAGHSSDDTMHSLEQMDYKPDAQTVKIFPLPLALFFDRHFSPLRIILVRTKPLLPSTEPPWLVPAWSFVRRAALPARAPALVA